MKIRYAVAEAAAMVAVFVAVGGGFTGSVAVAVHGPVAVAAVLFTIAAGASATAMFLAGAMHVVVTRPGEEGA